MEEWQLILDAVTRYMNKNGLSDEPRVNRPKEILKEEKQNAGKRNFR